MLGEPEKKNRAHLRFGNHLWGKDSLPSILFFLSYSSVYLLHQLFSYYFLLCCTAPGHALSEAQADDVYSLTPKQSICTLFSMDLPICFALFEVTLNVKVKFSLHWSMRHQGFCCLGLFTCREHFIRLVGVLGIMFPFH